MIYIHDITTLTQGHSLSLIIVLDICYSRAWHKKIKKYYYLILKKTIHNPFYDYLEKKLAFIPYLCDGNQHSS